MQKTKSHKEKIDLHAEFEKTASPQERFDYYMAHPYAKIDKELAQVLARVHVVLIGGLGSPIVKNGQKLLNLDEQKRYFGKLKKNLEEAGAFVTVRYPRSIEIEDSADKIIKEVPSLYRKGGNRPLVLFGHSRGGAVAVETVKRAPHLLRKGIIAKVATLQSPINGLHYTGSIITAAFANAGLGWLKPGGNFGIRPLLHHNIHKLFDAKALRKLSPRDQKLVSDSILWFTGMAEKIPLLDKLWGPTDGVVYLRNQRRKEYGFVASCFTKVNHFNSVAALRDTPKRDRSDALSLASLEVLARSLKYGPEWDSIVSHAEEKKIRTALDKGRIAPK